MSFLTDVGHFFKVAAQKFASIFVNLDADKINNVLHRVAGLAELAMPYVEMIAKMTPTTIDDQVVAVVEKLGIPVEKLLESGITGLDEVIHDGTRQRAVAELVKNDLLAKINSGQKIQVGDLTLTTAADVLGLSKSDLLTAANDAYSLFKGAQK